MVAILPVEFMRSFLDGFKAWPYSHGDFGVSRFGSLWMGQDSELLVKDDSSGTMMVCPSCDATYLPSTEVCPKDGAGLLEVPNATLLTGTDLDGRYQIGSVIGSGAMGTVYRAHQKSMERNVAIKVLHPKYAHDPRAVKRFFREAQAASRLIHPNIATVFDFGRSRSGHLYMVMELVEGWTLGDLIYYRAPLDLGLATSIARQVCEALGHAHSHHTVHRDLKPDNVQLTKVDKKVWAKVLDFGIARMTRDPSNVIQANLSTIEIAGTPAYMSPEQILGKAPDTRTDLYSLGIILFEMLTASRPFEDENSVTLCMKQLNDEAPTIESVLGEGKVPAEINRLVESLLSKNVDERPSTAEEVSALLKPFAGESGFEALAADLQKEVSVSLVHAPTRQDGGAALAHASALLSGAAKEPPGSLTEVIARVKLNMPSPFADKAALPCPDCGQVAAGGSGPCIRCGFEEKQHAEDPSVKSGRTRLLSRHSRPVATACVLAQAPTSLDLPILQEWVAAQEEAGHNLRRQPTALFIDFHGDTAPGEAERGRFLRALMKLAHLGRDQGLNLRIGFCLTADREAEPSSDHARRLAGVSPVGGVVIPTTQQGSLRVRAKPLTDTYLPTGAPLRCALVMPMDGNAENSGASNVVLFGRSAALRRLAQFQADAHSQGLNRVVLTGERGIGKSAVLREFASSSKHVYLRVAPLGQAWPGHTVARLVMALLGQPAEREPAAVQALYAGLPERTRSLLDVLLMQKALNVHAATSWLTLSELAAVVYDLLRGHAGSSNFTLILDDLHLVDPASAALLEEIFQLCRHEKWFVVGAGPPQALRKKIAMKDWIDLPLRSLGLRAATQFLESLGAPRARLGLLAELAGGNPLAIKLLATRGPTERLRGGNIIERHLPERLQKLSDYDADKAWSRAVYGDFVGDDLAVHASRMYLDVAPTPQIREWLTSRIRVHGGIFADLPCGWRPLTRSHFLARAVRHESLGLFGLAEAEYLHASHYHLKTQGVWERLEAARMRARRGDGDGAITLYQEAIEIGLTVAHTVGLLALGASLLAAGQESAATEVLETAKGGIVRTQASRLDTGRLWALLARCEVRQNNLPKAMGYLARSRELVDQLRNDDARGARVLEALVQEVRAEVAIAEGDAQAARINLRQGSDAYRDLGIMGAAIRALLMLGQIELDSGEDGRAADTFKACMALATSQGLSREAGLATVGHGTALLRTGQAEEGTQLLRRVLRARRFAQFEATAALGTAMLQRGLMADAARYGDRARALATCDGQRARAVLLLSRAQESPPQAARLLDEACRLLRRSGNGVLLGRIGGGMPAPAPEDGLGAGPIDREGLGEGRTVDQ